MPSALILSSHVAANRVGGTVQALALAAFGIDPILAPTVLFGRHPGRGAPGGGAVPIAIFEGMLDGIAAERLDLDLVITGYFASADQVRAAARIVDGLRADGRAPLIVIDPIMGDEGKGLYVPAKVAEAIASELIGRADLVRPNAWELERLTGRPVRDPSSARTAARALGRSVLVSSITVADGLGVVYADETEAWLAAHSRAPTAPNGTGDLLTALFAAHRLSGLPVGEALARATGVVVEAIAAANASGLADLPVVAMGGLLKAPSTAVRVERLG